MDIISTHCFLLDTRTKTTEGRFSLIFYPLSRVGLRARTHACTHAHLPTEQSVALRVNMAAGSNLSS